MRHAPTGSPAAGPYSTGEADYICPWCSIIFLVTTAVRPKIPHSNCCKIVPNRPLRGRRGRFGTLLQLLECGNLGRTAVRAPQLTAVMCHDQTSDVVNCGPGGTAAGRAHVMKIQVEIQSSRAQVAANSLGACRPRLRERNTSCRKEREKPSSNTKHNQ